MELPSRAAGDILLPSGEMLRIRERLRLLSAHHDLTTVIACAFDHRTRLLPFIYADLRMVPAGVRAIGSALADSGFPKTRIVLQQWNKNFRPSEMRLDGRIPDLFLVSSMLLHASECYKLIRDCRLLDPARRPLIIVGGPLVIYEPWKVFSADPRNPSGADVAVTGEEYVLLQLLELLLSERAHGESLRSAFLRSRDSGGLDGVPGLVYAKTTAPDGPAEELIDTGIQRLVGDLDELPHPIHGYGLIEAPGPGATLGSRALSGREVGRLSPLSSIVMTTGCKFRCSYCPIPAYNQRQHRTKSGGRVIDEISRIAELYSITMFFGTDDNFFNDADRTMEIIEPLARRMGEKKRPLCKIRLMTEATVHDTLKIREHLPLMRKAGLIAVWMGVEDMTGTLVTKGQTGNKTIEAFRLLRANGIHPIPMMMHHDSQPLVSWKSNEGLINQLGILRREGALFATALMLSPSPGSNWYEETYRSGLAFENIDGLPIGPHVSDGNFVIASKHPRPWMKQLSLLAGYTFFFNPLRLLFALVFSKSNIPFSGTDTRPDVEVAQYSYRERLLRPVCLRLSSHLIDAGIQVIGILGLIQSYRRTIPWALRLKRGRIELAKEPPSSLIPMRSSDGRRSCFEVAVRESSESDDKKYSGELRR
ncbi:MAG: radical SAM protein [Verrucomicrobiota bacterium]